MVEKFADSYRIRSSRLQNWDYGWRGQYYVIICTREGMLLWRDNRWANGRRDAMHGVSTSGTTDARMIISDFGWQTRFYGRIIRDEESLNNIQRYIKEKPGKWTIDELNPENE